ncbi:MAG TPA: MFS transporter [Planctomicrobium sp.]|nr:MFS transporter [Planctomicrobium sp.]
MTTPTEISNPLTPSIFKDRGFWGITTTQFLTVFNDNFYKQIVLFICVGVAQSGGPGWLQGLATIVFSLPFILFSGFCGYLSDLFSKRTIVIVSKVWEVLLMGIGLIAFMQPDTTTMITMMFVVLFLLGSHSALFGPAKYGLLPELFTQKQLPRVNGLFQMSMFIAIILGLWMSGVVLTQLRAVSPNPAENAAATMAPPDNLWVVAVICIAIATLGLIFGIIIRKTPVARPGLKFDKSDLIVNRETRIAIWQDKRLLTALAATSVFWATGGLVYPPAITDVGMKQFGLSEQQTGLMAAGTGFGIAVGCVLGMVFSKGTFNARLVRIGGWGMWIGLILLALPGSSSGTLLGPLGTGLMLVWLGVCAGMYNVPLQVLIQARAPTEHKGRVIGAMNLANWIGIYSSGIIYILASMVSSHFQLPHNLLFGIGAIFFLPIILFYRPQSETLSS